MNKTILKYQNRFLVICNECSQTTLEYTNDVYALAEAYDRGWLRRKEDKGKYFDLCLECQNKRTNPPALELSKETKPRL